MTQYLEYLDASAAALQAQSRMLQADGRMDEANFARVKANICGICKTVYEALQCAAAPRQFEQAYMSKLRRLRAQWQAAYDRAGVHGDAEKQLIEELKLQMLQKIQLRYLQCRRECHAGN